MFFSRNTGLREFPFRQFIGTGLGVLAEAVRNRVGIEALPQVGGHPWPGMRGRAFLYDANGNRLLSVTDNAGATVKYAYSGELSKMLALPEIVTDALGNTTTNIYDNFGRITETSLANGSGVVYTYTKGQLSELSRRTGSTTQNYSFVCNSFGRMTELKVGSRTLAKYEYAIGNGNLIEQTYGNEDYVRFGLLRE